MSSNPCGVCAACREIDEGRFVDLIEVDAASRTKVDDTRELLDNVQYAPTRGRYKVYLIDEVHMLSNHSFNALLKTLEEPPPHVKFLLATTDPQKLPVTVLSRCLQFSLKRLPAALIGERLKFIATAEKLPFEPAAVALLARAAEGSMRDALSLHGSADRVRRRRRQRSQCRARCSAPSIAATSAGWSRRWRAATAPRCWPKCRSSIATRRTMIAHWSNWRRCCSASPSCKSFPRRLPQDEEFDAALLTRLAQAISPEDAQLYYQIALGGPPRLEHGAGAAHRLRNDVAAHAGVSAGYRRRPAP